MATQKQIDDALDVVGYYTMLAAGTGALPVPAASAAIVVENGVMISHVASALGAEINLGSVTKSLSLAASLNIIGRTLFVEVARLLSWGTGNVWALAGVSALGATTAGVQTYVLGRLAIEIGKNNGQALAPSWAQTVTADAKRSYDSQLAAWKQKPPSKPTAAA